MTVSDKEWLRRCWSTPEPGPQKGLKTVDTKESSVFRPTDAREDTHPHACYEGVVYLTYTTFDPEVGDEVEKIEAIPCRRCADSPGPVPHDHGARTATANIPIGVERLRTRR